MNLRAKITAAAVAVLAVGGLALTASPASASTTPTITLPIAYPQGVSMDALNWAGTGTSASCATGLVNLPAVNAGQVFIGVWKSSGAGCAAHFLTVPLNGGLSYEITYAPNGVVATNGGTNTNGFCVSTYANVQGTHNRLRPCSAVLAVSGGVYTATIGTPNQWQTFHSITGQFDSGAVYIVNNTSGLAENDARYGGNGSPVITYQLAAPGNAANEGWTINP